MRMARLMAAMRSGKRSLVGAMTALLVAGAGGAGLAPGTALAGGGGQGWSQPQRVSTLSATPGSLSPLVAAGGQDYLVATIGGAPWLLTDAGGSWQAYSTGITDYVSGEGEGHYALAVSGATPYIAYIDTSNDVKLAFAPLGPAKRWATATIVPANASGVTCGPGGNPSGPAAAVVGGVLDVAFAATPACTAGGSAHSTDLYVATAPLASLSAGGAAPQWQVSVVTAGDTHGGFFPALAADGTAADLAYQDNEGKIFFVRGITGQAGLTWPGQPRVVLDLGSGDKMDRQKITLAAAGGVDVLALYAGGNTGDVWAATNAGGSWTTQKLLGQLGVGDRRPTAALGACGPGVAFEDAPSSAPGDQVVVATFARGAWSSQNVGPVESPDDPMWPGLAATASGMDLTYLNDTSGSPDLFAASLACAPGGAQPAGGAQGSGFGDLGGYGWAAGAINALAQQGIVKGTAPGTFDPAGQVTRAQFAALMQRMFQLPAPARPIAFTDVPQSYWGYAAVEATSPYFDYYQLPEGGYAFHPAEAFDRQDVATVIVRLLVRSGKLQLLSAADAQGVLAKLTDTSSIAPALRPYVATAIQAGILSGFPDGSFQPQGLLTRAQVAVVLQRLENSFVTVSGS